MTYTSIMSYIIKTDIIYKKNRPHSYILKIQGKFNHVAILSCSTDYACLWDYRALKLSNVYIMYSIICSYVYHI
jgi:hypothetical protein